MECWAKFLDELKTGMAAHSPKISIFAKRKDSAHRPTLEWLKNLCSLHVRGKTADPRQATDRYLYRPKTR